MEINVQPERIDSDYTIVDLTAKEIAEAFAGYVKGRAARNVFEGGVGVRAGGDCSAGAWTLALQIHPFRKVNND